jgi:2,4-dienoyl-CoA reductase-like NADH-dependent reductase (Old Yellow Enzyme family)
MTSLFDPIQFGAISARNRIVMAPLTRGRSVDAHVPVTTLKAEYYSQRASAGLIIAEATGISQEGLGWPSAPGIWSNEQVEAWKPVTAAVHEAGGKIVLQLWHMGRLVHPDFLGGAAPVSSSVTTAPSYAHTATGKKPYEPARALRLDEIPRVIDDYVHAARNAMAAGFDGVQLHGANGYLIDQFLRDNANFRTDGYGGSVENRIRLLNEVSERVVAVAGAERTGVRLSPNGASQGVDDSDPEAVFVPAAKRLEEIGVAFLELREPGPEGTYGNTDVPRLSPAIRKVFGGPLIVNSDYFTREDAQAALDSGVADAVSFGRAYLANPDLIERLKQGAPLNEWDMKSWYGGGAEGYTDYPQLKDQEAA